MPRLIATEKPARLALIRVIEKERDSRVIAYVTDPRGGVLGTRIADDAIPLFYEHLRRIGKVPRIDVLLQTYGGNTVTPNTLVHLLREYCDELGVLVPYRAMSAGTLFSLGANEIVMGPLASLGPVDPSVSNDFNPEVDDGKGGKRRLEISVEDVSGYIALARDLAGVRVEDMAAVLAGLTTAGVHPLSLGNVQRQYLLIRSLSRRLLGLHMNAEAEKTRIDSIVDVLTEKLYFHGYYISRHEAEKVIGLPIAHPSPALETAMWDLYVAYARALQLSGFEPQGSFVVDSAVIESTELTHTFYIKGTATKATATRGAPAPKLGVEIDVDRQGWEAV